MGSKQSKQLVRLELTFRTGTVLATKCMCMAVQQEMSFLFKEYIISRTETRILIVKDLLREIREKACPPAQRQAMLGEAVALYLCP